MSRCLALAGLVFAAGGRTLLQIDRLDLAQGERLAIVGPNGAGKSTLLRLLGASLVPQQGTIEVLGRVLSPPLPPPELRALRAEIGQVMQGLHLVSRLSARENVLIGALARVRGWRSWSRCFPAAEVACAETALAAVGLADRADTRADRLSGGERQKVAIARLLTQRPRLILADEPTAALDPSAAGEVCRLLVEAARHASLISVIHNPALLPLLADRVIGLKQGKQVFDLPLAHLDGQQLADLYAVDRNCHLPPARPATAT